MPKMTEDERRRLADANVVAAFQLVQRHFGEPAGGSRRFGGVQAIATGAETRFFNRVMALDPAASPPEVIAAVDWIERRGWPLVLQLSDVTNEAVRDAVEARGLRADPWRSPVMVLEPIPVRREPAEGLQVRTGGAEIHADFLSALPTAPSLARALGPGFASDRDVRLVVGYLGRSPVARAAAIRDGSTIGIYVVGTDDRFRRRGIGRAVTWAAIEAGVEAWGGTLAVLQSSEMGVPLYASMGFEVIGRYSEHDRPRA
jgi:ribosomal protein S18 acetylase RimI-like enzyme